MPMVGESLLFKSESEEQSLWLPPAYENLSQHFLKLTCRHISFILALRSEKQSQKSKWATNTHPLLDSGPPTSWPSGELKSLQGAGVSPTSLWSILCIWRKLNEKDQRLLRKRRDIQNFLVYLDTVIESLYWLSLGVSTEPPTFFPSVSTTA